MLVSLSALGVILMLSWQTLGINNNLGKDDDFADMVDVLDLIVQLGIDNIISWSLSCCLEFGERELGSETLSHTHCFVDAPDFRNFL